MAEYFFAKITLRKSDITPAVEEQLAQEKFDDEEEDEQGKVVSFAADEARWGCFSRLEDWLVDHGIAFDRFTGPGCGDPPSLRQFRPGGVNREVSVNSFGEPMVGIEKLKPLLSLSPEEAFRGLAQLVKEEGLPAPRLEEV